MKTLQEFENKIMNAALNIENEEDAKIMMELLTERQDWFISIGEDEMRLLYKDYKDSNDRLVNFLYELREDVKDKLSNAAQSHSVSQKYRLYD